jgi:acetoin utilization deacetylase AcuC-like enzyme
MRFHFHPGYVAPLPPGHRFPMSKYETTHDALVAAGVVPVAPEEAPRELILAAHAPAYADAVIAASVDPAIERRIGFAVTPEVSRRSRLSVGGTWASAVHALEHGFAANVAGGSHHAMPDGGAGYCVLNDLAITAAALLREGRVTRVQGDGTAACLAGVEGAFPFSIHAERNFPARKVASWHDIGLPDGTDDARYLETLADALPGLFAEAQPELVLVQAGVDPHADDRLGRLALSDEGLIARDTLVRQACLAAGVPFAATLGGGYDPDVQRLGVRHARSLLTLAGLSVPAMP